MFNDPNFVQNPVQGYDNPHLSMYYPHNQFIYNTNYLTGSKYDNTDQNTTQRVSLKKRQAIEQDIENFLLEVEKSNNTNGQRNVQKSSKIAIAKNTMNSVYKLNEKLRVICTELKNSQDLSNEEWQEKIDICKTVKFEIMKLLEPIKDENFLKHLKKDVERRKKKRLREKLKKDNWRKDKLLRAERRARLHAEIDSWIRKEQAVIEKEKQDENLRKDADLILFDVRGKRSDARKYLGLLQELQNLRNIKANIARARGEHLSLAADKAFNNIIAKLVEQWSALDREYSIEEQGLKLMLKTDNEKRIEKQKKSLFDDWENVLFGRKISMPKQSHTDLINFVAIRTAWDKYISSDSEASSIPIGWIVPDKPSSAAWQKCLKQDVS